MYTEATILLLLFIALLAGYRYINRMVFTPWNITLVVWIFVLSMYIFVDHGLYDITEQLIYGLLIWVLSFTTTSFFAFKYCPENKAPKWEICNKNLDILLFICLMLVPYAAFKAVGNAVKLASPQGLFFTLREQAVHPELYDIGPVKYFVYVVYVLFMIEINRYKIKKIRFFIALLLGFMFFFITMAKITFFMFVVSGLYLLYEKKKISLKPIVIFFSSFLFLAVLFQALRGADGEKEVDSDSVLWFLAVYVVAPMQAFCTDVGNSSVMFGEHTFRPLYNLLSGLGFDFKVHDAIERFVLVPLPTNVYTMMSPYFRDFGYWGIFVFGVIEGIATGCLCKLSATGNTIIKYIYTYFLVLIFLQFFEEDVFYAISSILYITIIVLFCHVKFVWSKSDKT